MPRIIIINMIFVPINWPLNNNKNPLYNEIIGNKQWQTPYDRGEIEWENKMLTTGSG